MLDRDVILQQAVDDCYEEMYQKAQPSVSYKEIISKVESGEIKDTHEDPLYNKYYLSQEEFEYIKDKYKDAYGITSHWNSNIETLESYLLNGGSKDKYIPTTMDDTGYIRPGYRSYETLQPLAKQIRDIIQDDSKSKDVVDAVFNTISSCKNFYRFDREEQQFEFTISLGCSPTSNKQTVIDYWKSKGKDISIEDRNPLLFWDKDYYGDELEDVMREEYGPNWEKYWNNKYKKQQAEDKAKREAKLKSLQSAPKINKFKIGDLVRREDDKLPRSIISIQENGYKIEGGFIPFKQENKWYHCYEQFKNYC